MSWNESSYVSADVRDVRVTAFLSKVYGWMFLGLLLTAGTAVAVASSPALIETLILNRGLFWIMIFAQLGLVLYLSVRVDKMAPATAAILFLLYSALVGVTTSSIFMVYTGASIVSAFVIAGGMFGAMAVFGTLTKRSLAGVGQFMFMGLIGLIIASIVNIFLVQRHAELCDFSGGRGGVHRPHSVGRAAAEGDGGGAAGRSRRIVCRRRRTVALPRLHQPVLLHPALNGRPSQLTTKATDYTDYTDMNLP